MCVCHWAVFNRVLPRVLGDKNVLCFSLTASVCFCVCLHTSELLFIWYWAGFNRVLARFLVDKIRMYCVCA